MKKLLMIGLILIAAICGWYWYALTAPDSSSRESTIVIIESGWSSSRIAVELGTNDLIRSSLAFRIYLRLNGLDSSLQAGKFVLSKAQSVAEIVSILREGKAQELALTIPEGFTVKDIDRLLASKGLIATGALLDCVLTCDFATFDFLPKEKGLTERGGRLEGYLFPDTYFVSTTGFVPKFFLERLLGAFRKNVIEGMSDELKSSGRSLHQIVTMASLIEEETRTDEERAIVAGILWKRFDDGRGLGVDATVRYILGKPTQDITHADLNTNSPYNTRKFKGLPPGPIANAGLKSIRATLKPEKSAYWYYLHDPEGVIHYALTNEEHNINRYKYLGSGRQE
ncbi:endolytic transglycosylase MltG [Candidatus Peregrinibacteria bacterium]|nr:endolytic transglycosylase MltG [Candidatus Peregrinibacteria bacterium]